MANKCNKTFRDMIESGQAQILGIVSEVPMGDWSATTTYQKLNYVRHNGATYKAKKSNTNVEPSAATNWEDVWMLCNYDGGLVVPDGTYPDMTVGNATNAQSATKATQDGDGNNIESTYAKQNGTYNDMSVGHASNAGYATSAASATNATNATNATKATQDGNGDVITSTYVKQSALLDLLFPVGSIYMNYANSDTPASILGGSWVRLSNQFLIGAGDDYTIGSTGGEVTHLLTANEMPAHTHTVPVTTSNTASGNNPNYPFLHHADSGVYNTESSSAGGNVPHNNMPPYRAVWMWRRTA